VRVTQERGLLNICLCALCVLCGYKYYFTTENTEGTEKGKQHIVPNPLTPE
jgi:hypothetical protein